MQDYAFLQAQVYVAIVAEEGSFTRAALRLGTSQSAVTNKIAKLERTLGARLFDRSTRKVELTTAGKMLLPDVQVSLRHAERAWELAQHSAHLETAPIRLGYSPYVHSALLAMLYQFKLSDFGDQRANNPEPGETPPHVQSTDTPDLIEQVLRGHLQVGIGEQPIENPMLWKETVAHEGFSVCVSRNHTLARRTAVAVRDFNGEMLFWLPRKAHPGFYDQTLEYIHSTGARPVLHEVASPMHAIEMVVRGVGIALLPRAASRLSCPGTVFKPVTDRFLEIETAIFARRDLMRGRLEEFVMFLSSRLRGLKLNSH